MTTAGFKDVSGSGFAFYEIASPTSENLNELRERLPFIVEEDLSDCLPPFERPKLIERENYLFLVLLYPYYNEETGIIRPTEVDFMLGKDFLVVFHDETLPEMKHLTARRSPHLTPIRMMIEMAHELTVTRFPILKDISNELIDIENRLFDSGNGSLIRDILKARSNILSFRESMQGHTMALSKLTVRGERFFDVHEEKLEIDELIAHIDDIWNFLSNDRDTAETLYESHLSLVTMKTNHAMKSLTALAFVIFPTSLAAAIFAMGAEHMPITGHPHDFWIMLGVVLAVMASILTFVKLKRWL